MRREGESVCGVYGWREGSVLRRGKRRREDCSGTNEDGLQTGSTIGEGRRR